jgi:transposase
MRRFVGGGSWARTLLPECLDDFIDENNPVRVIDVFVDALDFAEMSFEGAGRPSYHPSVLLKLYIYGYLNRVAAEMALSVLACNLTRVVNIVGVKPLIAAIVT